MLEKNKRTKNLKLRRKFMREHASCELCGHEATDPHHIVTIGSGGSDNIYNILAVCRECHTRIHEGKYTFDQLVGVVVNREDVDPSIVYECLTKMRWSNIDEK